MEYSKRLVDKALQEALESTGAVLIEGPRGCGKTSTGKQFSNSFVSLDTDENALKLATLEPLAVLAGPSPKLIDEWQLAPSLWNHVRKLCDESQTTGLFVLTGSAILPEDGKRHTGAIRILRLKMRPMSLFESGHSDGSVSLASLFVENSIISSTSGIGFMDLIDPMRRGGWPSLQKIALKNSLNVMRSYVSDISKDKFVFDEVRASSTRITKLIKALARNTGSEIPISKLTAELESQEAEPLKRTTVDGYVEKLKQIMVVENLEPWTTHLRSKYLIRRAEKRYFVDPSIPVAALKATPDKLLKDLETTGFIFENLVIRDLRIYSQAIGAEINHYRDESGLEVDAIITDFDGKWAAFEIKLNLNSIEDAVSNLLKLKDRIDTDKAGEPAALAVITTGQYSYRREDGIVVISIGSLGP